MYLSTTWSIFNGPADSFAVLRDVTPSLLSHKLYFGAINTHTTFIQWTHTACLVIHPTRLFFCYEETPRLPSTKYNISHRGNGLWFGFYVLNKAATFKKLKTNSDELKKALYLGCTSFCRMTFNITSTKHLQFLFQEAFFALSLTNRMTQDDFWNTHTSIVLLTPNYWIKYDCFNPVSPLSLKSR